MLLAKYCVAPVSRCPFRGQGPGNSQDHTNQVDLKVVTGPAKFDLAFIQEPLGSIQSDSTTRPCLSDKYAARHTQWVIAANIVAFPVISALVKNRWIACPFALPVFHRSFTCPRTHPKWVPSTSRYHTGAKMRVHTGFCMCEDRPSKACSRCPGLTVAHTRTRADQESTSLSAGHRGPRYISTCYV